MFCVAFSLFLFIHISYLLSTSQATNQPTCLPTYLLTHLLVHLPACLCYSSSFSSYSWHKECLFRLQKPTFSSSVLQTLKVIPWKLDDLCPGLPQSMEECIQMILHFSSFVVSQYVLQCEILQERGQDYQYSSSSWI